MHQSVGQPQLNCCWAPGGGQLAVWGHLSHRAACCQVLNLLGPSQQTFLVDGSGSMSTDAWRWSPCGRLVVHLADLKPYSCAAERADSGSVGTMFSANTGQVKLKITMYEHLDIRKEHFLWNSRSCFVLAKRSPQSLQRRWEGHEVTEIFDFERQEDKAPEVNIWGAENISSCPYRSARAVCFTGPSEGATGGRQVFQLKADASFGWKVAHMSGLPGTCILDYLYIRLEGPYIAWHPRADMIYSLISKQGHLCLVNGHLCSSRQLLLPQSLPPSSSRLTALLPASPAHNGEALQRGGAVRFHKWSPDGHAVAIWKRGLGTTLVTFQSFGPSCCPLS